MILLVLETEALCCVILFPLHDFIGSVVGCVLFLIARRRPLFFRYGHPKHARYCIHLGILWTCTLRGATHSSWGLWFQPHQLFNWSRFAANWHYVGRRSLPLLVGSALELISSNSDECGHKHDVDTEHNTITLSGTFFFLHFIVFFESCEAIYFKSCYLYTV